MIGMSNNKFQFHRFGGAGKKQYEKEQEEKRKKRPTQPFEDAAKATEGLRENIRKMGERKEEEKKKKPIEPQKGFFRRMMDKYRGTKE